MSDTLQSRYTAAQLGQLSGVGVRNVRYYVRETLIDPPTGRGRGAHFDNRHLSQLHRVRILQEAGLDHAAIRKYGAEIEAALAARGISRQAWDAEGAGSTLDVGRLYRRLAGKRYRPQTSAVTRVSVAEGIELLVDSRHRLPAPSRLGEAVSSLRAAFNIDERKR